MGDLLVDVVARPEGPLRVGSDTAARVRLAGGGSAANTAAWIAHRGGRAALLAAVGDDALGAVARRDLAAAGVELVGPVLDDVATGTCVVIVGPDGERTMLPDRGANDALPATAVEPALDSGVSWVHVSGYALLHAGSRAAGRGRPGRGAPARPADVGRRRQLGPAARPRRRRRPGPRGRGRPAVRQRRRGRRPGRARCRPRRRGRRRPQGGRRRRDLDRRRLDRLGPRRPDGGRRHHRRRRRPRRRLPRRHRGRSRPGRGPRRRGRPRRPGHHPPRRPPADPAEPPEPCATVAALRRHSHKVRFVGAPRANLGRWESWPP